MPTIEKKLIDTIKSESQKFKDDPKIKAFEAASHEFKHLVEQGIIKERGYNLLTVENAHLNRLQFNVKE
ncbi:MAG: hypothetical protein BWY15_02085 [Firmicutes bacterium ADurb.Bin193]|nr:MAG: hypothetical protein BWY15_02085 [Firmicutes bacterium ADurb.Bin193]